MKFANRFCFLGRFSKQMIRKGLSDFPTLVKEKFTYLYRLKDEPSLTKMQLIEKTVTKNKRNSNHQKDFRRWFDSRNGG